MTEINKLTERITALEHKKNIKLNLFSYDDNITSSDIKSECDNKSQTDNQ